MATENMDMPFNESDRYTTYEEKVNKIMNPNKKYEANKFYVGSNSVFDRNWGHGTENAAINHARKLLDEQNKDEIFIVKIVKVVKRRVAPVEA